MTIWFATGLPFLSRTIPIVRPWAQVSAGHSHTCAIDTAGALYCWGANDRGQTGTARVAARIGSPTVVAEGTTWLSVSARQNTTCGIQSDHSLWCWGANTYGQLGNNDMDFAKAPKLEPVKIGADSWTAVQASFGHTCAIRSDQRMFCWGRNSSGELGDGTTTNRLVPTVVSPVQPEWKEVSLGSDTTCGLAPDGKLWCWGSNNDFEFGVGAPPAAVTPLLISATDTWSHIAIGQNHGCGILTSGSLRCWGYNGSGQLGDGTKNTRAGAAMVADPAGARTDWVEITASEDGICALAQDGAVYCWGESTQFQLGVGDDAVPTPVTLGSTRSWSHVSTGVGHTCMIASDAGLWCIGNDGAGQLGDGGTSTTTPIRVDGEWNAVATGLHHTCALSSTGAVKCAGRNNGSQLGVGHSYMRAVMTGNGLTGYATIMSGDDHSCATLSNQLTCWGSNYRGQLGTGNTTNASTPQPIRAAHLASGTRHTCAIDATTNGMFCFGDNEGGQLGNGMTSTTPGGAQVGVTGQWSRVDAGRLHTCAVDTSGAAYCWGENREGQLGTGTYTDILDTNTKNGLTGITRITAGGSHSCAIQGNGVARCWGAGSDGQIGVGDTNNHATAVALSTTYLDLSAGEKYTCGVRTDRTLWCWGNNTRGTLGNGTLDNTPTPAQVGMDADWLSVSAYDDHTCGIRANNELYCWGDNNDGQLGTGTASRTALRQVP